MAQYGKYQGSEMNLESMKKKAPSKPMAKPAKGMKMPMNMGKKK